MSGASVRAHLERLRKQATHAVVPSGILLWWGGATPPDGLAQAPVLTQPGWLGWYGALRHAALAPDGMAPPPALTARLRAVAQDGPVPLAVAHFRYARPQAAVIADFTRAAERDRPPARPPRKLADCLEERNAFFCSLLLPDQWGAATPAVRAQVFQVVLERDWFLRGAGLPWPDEMTLDCGRGARTLRFGDPCLCTAYGRDAIVFELRARYGTRWLVARCRVALSDRPPAPAPDAVWSLAGAGGARGEARVYRAPQVRAARRHVLVGEGFPGGYPPGYLYDNVNQHGLLEQLRRHGHDVVIVSWAQGLAPMEHNAEVMIAAIRRASREGRGHAVGGVSMGGLIARYALCLLENRGVPHDTTLYFSIDSPHRGSRTSVADQWFAHYFRDSVPQLDLLCALLDSAANQQFLPQWYHDGEIAESGLRARFLRRLAALGGWPQQCRRIALASGHGNGGAAMPPSTTMLTWGGSPFVSAELRSQPAGRGRARIASGASYRARRGVPATLGIRSPVSWEAVPGSLASYNELLAGLASVVGCGDVALPAAQACVVPTVSALDLDGDPLAPVPPAASGRSPFHDYLCAETNLPHIATTPAMADWLLERILAAAP